MLSSCCRTLATTGAGILLRAMIAAEPEVSPMWTLPVQDACHHGATSCPTAEVQSQPSVFSFPVASSCSKLCLDP